MRSQAAVILLLGSCFVLLIGISLATAGSGIAAAAAPVPDPDQSTAATAGEGSGQDDPALAQSPLCDVGGRLSNWWQYWEGIWIKPIEQHDADGYGQWVQTWLITTTTPGWDITIKANTWRCPGWQDAFNNSPDQTHCGPEIATYTTTHIVNLTMPISRVTTFSITSTVDCCELDETDIIAVNTNNDWGSSFFLRWARAPICPIPPTPTATATETATATATASATGTPTMTPSWTATATASGTATATGTATASGTPTETPTETATGTPPPTKTATPTESASATATQTGTVTYTATATTTGTRSATATATETGTATPSATATPTGSATSTPTATRTGYYWYFPVIFKDYSSVF